MTLSKINQKFHMITIANYCLITYAFLLPLSAKMASKILIPIVLCLFLSNEFKERLIFIVKNRIFQSFFLMLATYALWILGSEHINTAFFELQKLFKVFLPLLIIAMSIKKEFSIKIINSFLLAMFFTIIISYCMFFKIHIPYLQLSGDNVPFMMTYTQYATVISVVMGFSFFRLISKNKLNLLEKIFYSLLLILSFFNLLILSSLTGYFLLFFSIIMTYLNLNKKHAIKTLLIGAFFICLSYNFAYYISPSFKNKMDYSIQTSKELVYGNFTSSIGVRIGFLFYSIDSIKKNSMFGLGTGDHVYEIRNNIIQQETNRQNIEALLQNIPESHGSNLHNQFLDIILQFGIIGLIIFFNIFYQISVNKTQNSYLQPLQYLLIINILLLCFANPLFIYGDVERIFILLVALLIVPFEQTTLRKQEETNIHAI